jgi:MoxR-like ATPase
VTAPDNGREPTNKELMGKPLSKAEAAVVQEKVEWAAGKLKQAHDEVANVIYGQEDLINLFLVVMIAGGNLLAEGVPGVGKTLLVSNLAKVMGLDFQRVQCTPDLMPPDIIGTEILEQDAEGKSRLDFKKGPIFTQFLMMDEINRTGPRTQSATLQAMQEKIVTVNGKTHDLRRPFLVMATQNPVEHDGTYPLPEAQLDRFLAKVNFGYPDEESEGRIIVETTGTDEDIAELFSRDKAGEDLTDPEVFHDKDQRSKVKEVLKGNDLILMQKLARRLPLPEKVVEAIKHVVRGARPGELGVDPYITENVKLGPGPRAGQAFALMAKARALMRGDLVPNVDDVKALVEPVLEHRMTLEFRAKANGVKFHDIAQRLTLGL